MKKLISFLKGIRLGQILTICLVGLLVFVGTAFGSGSGLQAQAQTAGQVKEEVPETGATSPLEGGMNEFPDIDPRQDTSDADTKTEFLVNQAEQNVTKDYELAAPQQLGEKAQQKVQQDVKSVGKTAKGIQEAVTKGTQRGMQNIRGNT